jgi:hypothetical protein
MVKLIKQKDVHIVMGLEKLQQDVTNAIPMETLRLRAEVVLEVATSLA